MISQKASELSTSEVRILSLASIGGALEFYDFVIFVFFATVIGKLFFAASLPDWVRQVQTFGIFAAGYLARPIGGVVMAHFGDTRGRKRMFTLSVLLMAIPTLLIGLLPTYQSIGVAAPLLLLLMRVLQGVAIGGEAPGAWVFVAEHARRGRVGFAVGLLTSGLSFGLLLGASMATCLNRVFSQVQLAAGAWRIPFLTGGVFGFIAMWLRRWLKETPMFEEMRNRAKLSRELPLGSVLKNHGRAVVTSILSTWMLTAAIVVVILMTPSLLPKLFGFASDQVQTANLVATIALCVSTVAVGAATDRFGVRRVAIPILLLLIASTYGLYRGAEAMPVALLPLYALAGFGAGGVVLTPIMMIHAFPTSIRFSGVSFSYNFAYALFGGLTPLLVSWLVHLDRIGPAHYVAVVTVVGLCATLMAPKHALSDVDTTAHFDKPRV
ncbi:MAG: ral substrate transporter [Edaphobacter sp.]|nr:ral substrate transporter [Edaphobacter sp.]